MKIILYLMLIIHITLQIRFVHANELGASVPAYSWLARLRTLQRAKETEFQVPEISMSAMRKDQTESKLSKRDKSNTDSAINSLNKQVDENNHRKEGDIMSCIDEFAREFERKWHMDPKRGIKKGRDTMSEEEIWNRLPRSDGKTAENNEGGASDDVASLENITKMLSFSDGDAFETEKAAKEYDISWKSNKLHTREERRRPVKVKDSTDNNVGRAQFVRKNHEDFDDDKPVKNDYEHEKDVKLLDNGRVKTDSRVMGEEETKNQITHEEIKRVMSELEEQDEQRGTAKDAHESAQFVENTKSKTKKYITPASERRNSDFLESNMRDPPRYVIKVDGNGYITSDNERYLQKLTDDRANSELLLSLNELRQEQRSPKVKSLEENLRCKREFKQFNDDNSENTQNRDYLKQLEDSFPRDQGDYGDQVLKELKEHVRVKRVMFI